MQPVASTFGVTAHIIEILGPVALFLAALFLVRPRRPKGYILIAVGAALMFAMRLVVPVATYLVGASETLRGSATLSSSISLVGALIALFGMLLVILGITRLAKIKIK
jgi:hypothetical protein